MLPRKHSLPITENTFKLNYKVFRTTCSLFKYRKNHSYLRVLISVSKKVSKKAVERNSVKRSLSELIHTHFDLNTPLDLIITPLPQITATDFQTKKQTIIELQNFLVKNEKLDSFINKNL